MADDDEKGSGIAGVLGFILVMIVAGIVWHGVSILQFESINIASKTTRHPHNKLRSASPVAVSVSSIDKSASPFASEKLRSSSNP